MSDEKPPLDDKPPYWQFAVFIAVTVLTLAAFIAFCVGMVLTAMKL